MDEIKYKVLKEFNNFKEGDIINSGADELDNLTEEEMTQLLADGTLEVVSEDEIPAAPSADDGAGLAPAPKEEDENSGPQENTKEN